MPPKGIPWSPLVERACVHCARKFRLRQAEMTHGHHTGQFCGRECVDAYKRLHPGAPVKFTPESTPKERVRANCFLNMRIKRGVIARPDRCQECGKVGKVDGHHESYAADQKAVVEWLCRSCHMKRHHKPRAQAS